MLRLHKISVTPPFIFQIEMPVPSQESERSYICVIGVTILPLSIVFYWIFELFRQYGTFSVFRNII